MRSSKVHSRRGCYSTAFGIVSCDDILPRRLLAWPGLAAFGLILASCFPEPRGLFIYQIQCVPVVCVLPTKHSSIFGGNECRNFPESFSASLLMYQQRSIQDSVVNKQKDGTELPQPTPDLTWNHAYGVYQQGKALWKWIESCGDISLLDVFGITRAWKGKTAISFYVFRLRIFHKVDVRFRRFER